MEQSDKQHFEAGKKVINQFSIVLRNGQLHEINNIAVLESMEKLQSRVNPYIESEGFLRIDIAGEFFYINDVRIRFSLEFILNFDYLAAEFKKRDIGSVIFSSPLSINDIKQFLRALLNAVNSSAPYNTICSMLKDVGNIQIEKLKTIEDEDEIDRRKIVKKAYFNAVSFSRGMIKKIKAGEKISIRKAKRIIESIVDVVLSEKQFLIGMTSIKDYDEYTYHHSINVSILSIAMGQRIGLNRRELTSLGIAALFHDIGKTWIPIEILNKPERLSEEEWEIVCMHPYWGAIAALKLKGLDEISMQNAIVAFQHHMKYDYSGYPKLQETMELIFYSKVISIADQYDAMTSSRVYRAEPMSPDKVLNMMIESSGSEIDPIFLKILANIVGVYPIGSLVLLDTQEMGLVYEGNLIISERPRVLVIVNESGNNVDGYVVDLTEKDSSGRFLRTIAKTLDPKKYNISLAEHLL